MARNKAFSVHDLYPADYCFDYEAFEADPEGYQFTADDIAYYNAMELERYEATVPMTAYEKRLLRNWVKSGHSPREFPPSKYLCLTGYEPYDFLDVHRMDSEIRKAMKGMNKKQRTAYLQEYMGWDDTKPESEPEPIIELSEPVNEDDPFGLWH